MEKIIIKKRHLDCMKKQRENLEFFSAFPNDLDGRLKRSIELRTEFSDIIPISGDTIEKCKEYLNALDNENYEICNKFYIEF